MDWHGHHLSADSPIIKGPPPGQRHWDPLVDARLSVWTHVGPNGSFDVNVTPACGELWSMHWGDPGQLPRLGPPGSTRPRFRR